MSSYDESTQDSMEEPRCKRKRYEEISDYALIGLQDVQVTGRASGGVEKDLALNANGQDMESLQLIDEIEGHDDEDSESQNDDSLYDSEVPEEEIDALLEEGLPEEMKGPRSQRRKTSDDPSKDTDSENVPFEKKEKVMLVEKAVNHFEVLPEGWVEVTHNSGMPVFLHKDTRVCTFSRPYFLGSGSVRKHSIPLSAIPCLKYLKDIEESERIRTQKNNVEKGKNEEKENEEKENEEKENEEETQDENAMETDELPKDKVVPDSNTEEIDSASCGPLAKALVAQAVIPPVKASSDPSTNSIAATLVESVHYAEEIHSLSPEELRTYCQNRFEFKTVKILRFKTWGDKHRYEKTIKWRNRPQLPEGTTLISLKRKNMEQGAPFGSKKEWVINPKGKSYVCILHEYVQHVLKSQPKYEFKEVENASTPYAASISINDVMYSTGYGSSKKQAKMEAAKATLEILLPELGKKIRMEKKMEEETDLSFFDEIRVENPRVPELCNKTSELPPYSILLNCLQRNFGLSGANISCRLITQKNQKNEFIMTLGKHTVEVSCRNKKDGKQRASQAILQKLHPHITSWGSLLRLYGNRSLQTMRGRKAEEQEVTLLQTNASLHQPNNSIINKLKEEMLKLKYMKNNIQPIGKFFPPENICIPTTSGTELNNVDL